MKRKKILGAPGFLPAGDLVLQMLLQLKKVFLEKVVVATTVEEKINLLADNGDGTVMLGFVVGRTDPGVSVKAGSHSGEKPE